MNIKASFGDKFSCCNDSVRMQLVREDGDARSGETLVRDRTGVDFLIEFERFTFRLVRFSVSMVGIGVMLFVLSGEVVFNITVVITRLETNIIGIGVGWVGILGVRKVLLKDLPFGKLGLAEFGQVVTDCVENHCL